MVATDLTLDVVGKVFDFRQNVTPVPVSVDGHALPQAYVYGTAFVLVTNAPAGAEHR